jgi:hypothetical protein
VDYFTGYFEATPKVAFGRMRYWGHKYADLASLETDSRWWSMRWGWHPFVNESEDTARWLLSRHISYSQAHREVLILPFEKDRAEVVAWCIGAMPGGVFADFLEEFWPDVPAEFLHDLRLPLSPLEVV